jgi:DNA polymerase sigma
VILASRTSWFVVVVVALLLVMTQGLTNTALLKCYTRVDERVISLGLAVKFWAKSNNLNDASQVRLSLSFFLFFCFSFLLFFHFSMS